MNIYKYYLYPEELNAYKERNTKVPFFAVQDAIALHRRIPEAEPYIIKHLPYAYSYARDVIKGRWPEAEPYIMKNAWKAYEYAKYIIKGRWPEAEPYIKQNPEIWREYTDFVGGN